jgi:hypothetical protein
MKKLLAIGALAFFSLTFTSCGGGHICDAYGGQADYSSYKAEQIQKIEMVQVLTEQTK